MNYSDIIWNFRDVATLNKIFKKGRIFRSSSLTPYQDEPFFEDFIKKHNINKIIDLRDEREYAENPYSEKSLQLFEHFLLSIDPCNQSEDFIKKYHYGTNIQIAYRHFAAEHQHIFKAIFDKIDPENDVFLIHCHAGKDRTGSVVALLGLLLGEERENIIADYLESEMDTEEEKLNAFLEIVQEKQGVISFLEWCGVSAQQMEKFINGFKKENDE